MTKFLSRTVRAGSASVNESITDQLLDTGDELVTGSEIPLGNLSPRATIRHRLTIVKTAAGVATPIIKVRVGTAGSAADTARHTHTLPAQTAAVDTCVVEVDTVVRSVASGTGSVTHFTCKLAHNLATTGFSTSGTPITESTSGGYDLTADDLILSLSIDPGASGAWTVKKCVSELVNT
jgi:hypothetical protein